MGLKSAVSTQERVVIAHVRYTVKILYFDQDHSNFIFLNYYYYLFFQSIGALNTWPNAASQSLVEHTNQIADEARAGGAAPGVHAQGAPVFDHVHAAAAVAGAANLANNLQQPQAVAAQPQAGAQPGLPNQHNVQNGVINQVPGENGGQNMAGPGGPDGPLVMNAGMF